MRARTLLPRLRIVTTLLPIPAHIAASAPYQRRTASPLAHHSALVKHILRRAFFASCNANTRSARPRQRLTRSGLVIVVLNVNQRVLARHARSRSSSISPLSSILYLLPAGVSRPARAITALLDVSPARIDALIMTFTHAGTRGRYSRHLRAPPPLATTLLPTAYFLPPGLAAGALLRDINARARAQPRAYRQPSWQPS